MISRSTVFDKIHSESIIFNRKAIYKKVYYPHFIIWVNGLVQGNGEKINLVSVMSLYDPDSYRDHVVKIQNPAFIEESPAS